MGIVNPHKAVAIIEYTYTPSLLFVPPNKNS